MNRSGALWPRILVPLLLLCLQGGATAADLRTQSCQVRPGCALLSRPGASCEAVLAWTGSCSAGMAHGTGAAAYVDGTANYGWYEKGRLSGSFVWHRNGYITLPGEYQSHVITLDAQGNSDGAMRPCSWDEWNEQLVPGEGTHEACHRLAGVLGPKAFSPDLWRSVARMLTGRQQTVAANTVTLRTVSRRAPARGRPGASSRSCRGCGGYGS